MEFRRYAVYYTLPDGPLAEFGAAWLGWDAWRGARVGHPRLPGLARVVGGEEAGDVAAITAAPRKYGLHGTMKPPLRLAAGQSAEDLARAIQSLADTLVPVRLAGLQLSRLGRFLALTPVGATAALEALAADVVRVLDPFRAPASEAELARRRKAGLSPRQEQMLCDWGYPYVMQEFRFHITLTGRLPADRLDRVALALGPVLQPLLPVPFVVDGLTLAGEDDDGRFHNLHRYALCGGPSPCPCPSPSAAQAASTV